MERFLTFLDVSSDRTAPAISSVVKQILRRYGDTLKDKLIMQTYDGASVMLGFNVFFVMTTLTFSIVLLIN